MATPPPSAEPGAPPPDARSAAMSALLARNWGFVMLRGVLALLFGLMVILLPGPALAALVLLFSAYMLADGVVSIVLAVRAARRHERWGWFIAEGVIDILAGALAFLMPGIAILSFVLVVSAWAIVSGIAMLVAAFRLRPDHGRWWLIAGGLLSVVWGVLLFLQPGIGALVLTLWLGAYAAAFGIVMIVLAFRLRSRQAAGTAQTGV